MVSPDKVNVHMWASISNVPFVRTTNELLVLPNATSVSPLVRFFLLNVMLLLSRSPVRLKIRTVLSSQAVRTQMPVISHTCVIIKDHHSVLFRRSCDTCCQVQCIRAPAKPGDSIPVAL